MLTIMIIVLAQSSDMTGRKFYVRNIILTSSIQQQNITQCEEHNTTH
jgi:hypothetical protein